ncbi:unnamed protein product [Chilo suppressalis]|uniref:Leucine-rich repeat-containing protein 71 n=1 Tax=Chilo suppressalis TaxID=168631 RepID=A0ABN8B672_CHISP|nr:unnamed protein product [Chilo suppressalis]
MKPYKSASLRSVRSGKSSKPADTDSDTHTPLGFEAALYAACLKYNFPYKLYVKKEYQPDEFLKKLKEETPVKYKKITVTPRVVSPSYVKSERNIVSSPTTESTATVLPDVLLLTSVYDNAQNLVEIKLNKIKDVPRTLVQIISYLVRPHDHLAKISFDDCLIDYVIIHELNKIISLSRITDISFDRTTLPEEYLINLLNNKNASIKYLSLSCCKINDNTCKEIASTLHFSEHAEKTLMVLNLSSNHITDEGAKHLGEALRTNRHLRYLNLADNRIGDDGAIAIFNSLTEFPLTFDEIMNKRRSLLEYLKAKRVLFVKYCKECDTISRDELSYFSQKSPSKRKKTSATSLRKVNNKKEKDARKDIAKSNKLNDNETKAEFICNEIMGPFLHPFGPNYLKNIDNKCNCLGNFTLCYLNLSYNNLMYTSLMKLLTVMQYQKSSKKVNQYGLIKVLIEGNNLPMASREYQLINDLFRIAKSMVPFSGSKISDGSVKKNHPAFLIRKK